MADNESKIKISTEAELSDLQQYTKDLAAARAELEALTAAMRTYQETAGNMPAGTSPQQAAPPPAHTVPDVPATPEHGGAPTPQRPPSMVDMQPDDVYLDPPIGTQDTPATYVDYNGRRRAMDGRFVSMGEGGGEPEQGGGGVLGRMLGGAGRFASNAASTAVGLGLGQGPLSFILGSGGTYMELSKQLTQVAQKFKDLDENAATFGQTLGYTIGQTAGLVKALGHATNTVTKGQVQRILGFARFSGMDAGEAIHTVGGIERTLGRQVDDNELAMLNQLARRSDMGEGRFSEFMQSLQRIGETQVGTMGAADLPAIMAQMQLATGVFGAQDPRSQGMRGVQFSEKVNAFMGGRTNPGMQSFFMRAIGFGSTSGEDAPGYVEMRLRQEAGLGNQENLRDLREAFKAAGMGRGAIFKVLERSGFAAQESATFSEFLADDEQFGEFMSAVDNQGELLDDFRSKLKKEDPEAYEVFKAKGMLGAGKDAVPMGAAREVQLEAARMALGRTMAQVMADSLDSMENIAKGLADLLNVDFHGLITGLTGAVERLTEQFEGDGAKAHDGYRNLLNVLGEGDLDLAGQMIWGGIKEVNRETSPFDLQGRIEDAKQQYQIGGGQP